MIAVMPDFARIDRELAAIGTVPEAVQPLLDLYGQRDRSLENVDQVLEALREGREPTSSPPDTIERPSFLPLGWDSGRKSDPGVEPAPQLALEREEITVSTGAPEAMPEEAQSAAASNGVPSDEVSIEGHIDTQQSSPPPPAQAEAEISASPVSEPVQEDPDPQLFEQRAARSSRPPRPDIQALLDAELDPREFPSTKPPPPRVSSHPPAVTRSEPAAQDELELLVDDDDILEIDDETA